jgi:hypothetical protein
MSTCSFIICLFEMSKAIHAIPPERIRALAAEKYGEEMEEGTAVILSELLDEMAESIIDWSVKVAETRGSNALDPEDVRFICEQEWGIDLSNSSR